jgi:hypothetical protein
MLHHQAERAVRLGDEGLAVPERIDAARAVEPRDGLESGVVLAVVVVSAMTASRDRWSTCERECERGYAGTDACGRLSHAVSFDLCCEETLSRRTA